jgi:hypothetical protein
VVVALGLWGCAGDPVERIEAARRAIKGGSPAPDDTAVVGILVVSSSATCTGALVAPNLVLTAQHCVAPVVGVPTCAEGSFGPAGPADDFAVTTKPTFGFDQSDYHFAVEVVIPPGTGFCGRDVALIVLDGPIAPSEAEPLVPRVDAVAAAGETYSAIGFGAIDDSGTGAGERRRRDDLTIACVGDDCGVTGMSPLEWTGEAGVCQGDSGGPALDTFGRVIGVASRGAFGCVDPTYGDVSANAQWLSAEAQEAADLGGYSPPPWSLGASTDPGYTGGGGAGGGGAGSTSAGAGGGGQGSDDDGPPDLPPSSGGDDDGGCSAAPPGTTSPAPFAAALIALAFRAWRSRGRPRGRPRSSTGRRGRRGRGRSACRARCAGATTAGRAATARRRRRSDHRSTRTG